MEIVEKQNVKLAMIEWLREHKNQYIVGIEPRLAADFNRFVRKNFPEVAKLAKEATNTAKRHCVRYSPSCVFTYINYDVKFSIKPTDPYPQSPTKAALLADAAFWLVC